MYYEDISNNRRGQYGGYSNQYYDRPTFADRTPRRSQNMIARPDNMADRYMSSMGIQRTATGRYQSPLRERRGLFGTLASILTIIVVAPIALTSKVINGVKDAFDDNDYDEDEYYERDYPKEVYTQKQNTRTVVHEQQDIHRDIVKKAKPQSKIVATANVQFDKKKQEIIEKTREKIRGSAGKPDLQELFSNEILNSTEYYTYSLGEPMRKNTSYELTSDKNIVFDLVNLVGKSISTLELREQCSNIVETSGKTQSEKFIFLFNKATNKFMSYKGSSFSNNFVKITYNIELYKNNIKLEQDSNLDGEFTALMTSKFYVQVPNGYQIKLKFFVS